MKLAKLLDLISEAATDSKSAITKLPKIQFALDYVSAQARTTEEYSEWLSDLPNFGRVVESSSREGAESSFIEFSEPRIVAEQILRGILIHEPAANKIYPNYGVAEVVYRTEQLTKLANELADLHIEGVKLEDQGDKTVLEIKVNEFVVVIKENSTFDEVLDRNKPSSPAEQITDLQNEIDRLRQQILVMEKDSEDKLKIMADFQNYRKRIDKEKASFGLIASLGIIQEVLDVVDDVNRTITDQDKDIERCNQMLKIFKDKLLATASGVGVDQIEINKGDSFDSLTMEAVGTVAVTEVDEHNRVVDVIQAGYKFRDKDQMMRMAKVIVGKFAKATT